MAATDSSSTSPESAHSQSSSSLRTAAAFAPFPPYLSTDSIANTTTSQQAQRSSTLMNVSSNMDAQSSFAPSQFAVDPGGQPVNAAGFLNGAPAQFMPSFMPYGNMQGIEGAGGEAQVPKFIVVDNLLERVIRTTKDARDAYARGREAEGIQRIAELKAVVDLVSTFTNPPPKPAPHNMDPPHIPDQKRVSPPSGPASRKASLSGPSPPLLQPPPVEDASRKRCASAQGDRVLKSLKLEPKEEALPTLLPGTTPLATASAPPAAAPLLAQAPPAPPPLLHTQTFPTGIHTRALAPNPAPHLPAPFPGAVRTDSTGLQQHAPPHHHLHHTLHVPGVHSPLAPAVVANGKPPAPGPANPWPDAGPALMQAPQSVPPRFRAGNDAAPQFHARANRSASYSGPGGTYPFAFSAGPGAAAAAAGEEFDPSRPSTSVSVADSSSPEVESDAEKGAREAAYLAPHAGNDIPQDLRLDVDRIFFQFLSMVCSDLDATDNKGEPIHQPLMAKKMQRLDESPDFRPFKFRIQAFTNGFLEELAKQGLPEEVIPMKKVRHYLWTNAYISRFNEDGKKAKSKGNHIWNIDAKKASDGSGGGWHFRPFRRRIAGSFPGVAYVGLRWQFQPRVWDPQAARSNVHVRFSSPALPAWLAWSGDILAGTPSADTPSTDIVVEARFTQDGTDVTLSQKYFLTVAPLSRDDPSVFMGTRRPSLGSDRRVLSDSAVAQATSVVPSRRPGPQPTQAAKPYHEALTVVTEAIKAVSIEAHSVQAAPNPDPEQQIQLQTFLTRQEQVLTVTAHAINDAMSAPYPAASEQQAQASSALARAGTDVVICALHKVAAEHSAVLQMTTGLPAAEFSGMQEVTMQEVSSATKTAVAQAVEQTNTLTSPIDVMLTAENIIQRNTQAMPPPPPPPQGIAGDTAQFPPIAGEGVVSGPGAPLNGQDPFARDVPILSDYTMTDAVPP